MLPPLHPTPSTRARFLAAATALLVLFLSAPVMATVIIIDPPRPEPPRGRRIAAPLAHPVRLESLELDVLIRDGVATTELRERVRNETGRRIQTQFVLPIPRGAAVHDATLRIGDQIVEAEVLEAGEARRIYEDIVRRAIDPALIEHLDDGLLRTHIFPIEPHSTREISLSLSISLPEDFGTWVYSFPLRVACGGLNAPESFVLNGRIESSRRLEEPYSPTHDLETRIERDGKSARFSLESSGAAAGARNLQLFVPSRSRELSILVASTKPAGEDGYLMARVSPGDALLERSAQPKTIVFVLDVSGSMKGEKIEQARAALLYCLGKLKAQDRFGLVSYSSTARWHTEGIVVASAHELRQAQRAAESLQARGGTNIEAALRESLQEFGGDHDGPSYVLFLSDGQPTVGRTDVDELLRQADQRNEATARIFTFGVGDDVNTRLMDGLAANSSALVRYVLPDEDLEASVSHLYDQISEPLLTELALSFGEAGVYDVEPGELGDLFAGQTLTVLARYRAAGRHRARLRGSFDGRTRRFEERIQLAARSSAHDYLPQLWAGRRIAALSKALRAGGDREELIEEIVELGMRYGIVTEYTSLFMREPDEQLARALREGEELDAVRRNRPEAFGRMRELASEEVGKKAVSRAAGEARRMESTNLVTQDAAAGLGSPSPAWSSASRRSPSGSGDDLRTIRRVDGWVFHHDDEGRWVEQRAVGAKPRLSIQTFSAAYFELLDLRPELRPALQMGGVIRLALGSDVLEISEQGVSELDDDMRGWLQTATLH